jgi:hypothetical protein
MLGLAMPGGAQLQRAFFFAARVIQRIAQVAIFWDARRPSRKRSPDQACPTALRSIFWIGSEVCITGASGGRFWLVGDICKLGHREASDENPTPTAVGGSWRRDLLPKLEGPQQLGKGTRKYDFMRTPEYASLRPHLNAKLIKDLEGPALRIDFAGEFPRRQLIEEIARIEREWKLV